MHPSLPIRTILCGILGFSSVPAFAADPAVNCEVAKLKESGKYCNCRFKAEAKGLKKGEAADYTKCETKFSEKWIKIEAKAGAGVCPTEGDHPAIESLITSCAANVAIELAGPTTTTSTTTTSSTTTTTTIPPSCAGMGPVDLSVQAATISVPGLSLSYDARTIAEVGGALDGLAGPTLHVKAGDPACSFSVTNNLDPLATQTTCPFHLNDLHCADTTALFGQGVTIAGGEGGATIGPNGGTRSYWMSLAADYPPALHLYRAGSHGSSGLQAMGGLAGLIEVEEADSYTLPSDLAALYDTPVHQPMLIQYVHMGSNSGAGIFNLRGYPSIANYYGAENPLATANTNTAVGFVVNGQVSPTVDQDQNSAALFRFASASASRSLELELSSGSCEMRLIARDGIFQTPPYLTISSIVLLPGSRADVAISCSDVEAVHLNSVTPAANTADLGTALRSSVTGAVLTINVNASAGPGVPFPTSAAPLPAAFDSLLSEPAVSPFDGATGTAIPVLDPGTGSDPSPSHGINGVSFPGYGAAEASRYAFVTCVGQTYELSAPSGVGPRWPISFSGFHVQPTTTDTASGAVFRQGEWRDVLPWKNDLTVRFQPTQAGEFEINNNVLEQSDEGMRALVRVCGTTETTGVCAFCP